MRKALVLTVLLLAGAAAHHADASFAAATGFSGRSADCTTCHAPAAPQPAQAHLDGVPETWRPDQRALLTVRVTGGPAPAPGGFPQGGFELEAQAGRVDEGPGMEELLRTPKPTIITYEPEGTLQRERTVFWTAPPATTPPTELRLWLATVAANGDHDPRLNASDGGERGDATATLVATVPPAPDVVEAWEALPLSPPVIDAVVPVPDGVRVEGHHTDANATYVAVGRGGDWTQHETGPDWVVLVEDPGGVRLRSEGTGRVSDPVALEDDAGAPLAPWLPIAAVAVALARRTA